MIIMRRTDMNELVEEGKSILEDTNAVTYEDMVDRANDWLKNIETALDDKAFVDEVYKIASETFKPDIDPYNALTVVPVLGVLEDKTEFFKEKVRKILVKLIDYNK